MAHSCPECGQCCYCNDDIDDCLFDFDEDSDACTHWKICESQGDEFEDYDDIEDEPIVLAEASTSRPS